MKVTFIGVGEAFDENQVNISMVLEVNNQNILLDCGYSVPHALWKHNPDKDYVDAVWISHPHADHYYGLGVIIVRMKDDGRTKPLYILTRPEIRKEIEQVIELSYPGSLKKAKFEIKFIEFESRTEFAGVKIALAPTIHPVPNKAIRIGFKDKIFCYSGDGLYTEESKDLFRGADLVVHETYTLDEDLPGHGTVKSVARIQEELEINKIAMVHIKQGENKAEIRKYIKGKEIILPEAGDTLEF